MGVKRERKGNKNGGRWDSQPAHCSDIATWMPTAGRPPLSDNFVCHRRVISLDLLRRHTRVQDDRMTTRTIDLESEALAIEVRLLPAAQHLSVDGSMCWLGRNILSNILDHSRELLPVSSRTSRISAWL